MPDTLIAEFSTRTAEVTRRIDEKLDRFVEHMEREPTRRERWRLEREAVVDSRPAKHKGTDAAQLHETWRDQSRALGLEPTDVIAGAVDRTAWAWGVNQDFDDLTVEWAMGELAEKQSSWRPAELVREVAAALPIDTVETAEKVVDWVRELATAAIEYCVDLSKPIPPGALLRLDGRPVTESAMDRALTTQAILDQEADLIGWADRRLAARGTASAFGTDPAADHLTPAQAEAAAEVSGHAGVVLVVGPAGTGKTTALAPAVDHLRAEGRAVFGVAPSATAAQVLTEETGVAADTLDKLLIEHRLQRPPDHRYDLPAGATVIVDEAGMMPTAKLAELADLADDRGWRLALVGDPLQFSAVGRGGMFGLLVDTFGAIELDEVHRFEHEWERDASLMLRRGEPAVAETYDAHGRIRGGTVEQMEHDSVARWWQHRQHRNPVLLMTPSTEATERLNQRCPASAHPRRRDRPSRPPRHGRPPSHLPRRRDRHPAERSPIADGPR